MYIQVTFDVAGLADGFVKKYIYECDFDVKVGDIVLVPAQNDYNFNVVRVCQVNKEVIWPDGGHANVIRQAHCKVDISEFLDKIERQRKADNLMHAMKERMKTATELEQIVNLAKFDSKMAKMLEEYATVTGKQALLGVQNDKDLSEV